MKTYMLLELWFSNFDFSVSATHKKILEEIETMMTKANPSKLLVEWDKSQSHSIYFQFSVKEDAKFYRWETAKYLTNQGWEPFSAYPAGLNFRKEQG